MSEHVFRMLGGEEVTVPSEPSPLAMERRGEVRRRLLLWYGNGGRRKEPLLPPVGKRFAGALNRGIGPDRE